MTGNHFTAMGLPVHEQEDLPRVIGTALRAASTEPLGSRRTAATWRDGSGSGLDVLLRTARWRGEPTVECATPQFAGTLRQTARVTSVLADECVGCTLIAVEVLQGSELVYPLVLAPARVAALRRRLDELAKTGDPVEASIVFVAEDIDVYPDEAAFGAAQDERAVAGGDGREPARLGAESLIPTGLFGAAPAPAALVNGTVTAARRVGNDAFGTAFWHLTVRTFGGEYDVLADPDDVAEVPVGGVVAVQAWVCGQVAEVA